MDRITKFFYQAISGRLSFDRLIKNSGLSFICPLYHAVSDEVPAHLKYAHKIRDVKTFKKDLAFFVKHFKAVNLDEFKKLALGEGGKKQRPAFLLSFDGGYREIYEYVLPILEEMNIPCLLFLNTAYLENESMSHKCKASLLVENLKTRKFSQNILNKLGDTFSCMPEIHPLSDQVLAVGYKESKVLDEVAEILEIDLQDYARKNMPYLTIPEILRLYNTGLFSIAANGHEQVPYSEIDIKEQIRQTTFCREELESFFPEVENVFAFPFSSRKVTTKFFRKIHNKHSFKMTFGNDGIMPSEFKGRHVERLLMESIDDAIRELPAAYLRYRIRKFMGIKSESRD